MGGVQVGGGIQWGDESKGANVRGSEGEQKGKHWGGGGGGGGGGRGKRRAESLTDFFFNLSLGFEMD